MIKKIIKKFLSKKIKSMFLEEYEKKIFLEGKKLSILNLKKKKINDLSEIEYKVFSQWGEDGIIDWITSKLKDIPKSFLEIGTENYNESNTRYLLQNKNWTGYIVEGNKKAVEEIKKNRIFWKYNLTVKNAFINSTNINQILKKIKIPKKIGLLSIDIDSIDYWVLKELKYVIPVIIVCEFNPLFGKKKLVTVPNKKNFIRTKEHFSNLYYGASIKAFQSLLKKNGYIFIGTNTAGNNAFFIKKNYSKNVLNLIKKKKIFESQFRESRNKQNKLNFLNKKESLNQIKNKTIYDLEVKRTKKISQLF